MNENLQNLLKFASIDKSLSSNDFRLLFFIATNDNINTDTIIKNVGIKNKNTISNCISKLIKLNYISRNINKKQLKLSSCRYEYIVNTNKTYVPKINNKPCNQSFNDVDYIYNYFFDKFPTNKKIAIAENKKAIYILLYDLKFTKDYIINFIDNLSDKDINQFNICRPTQLLNLLKDKKVS